jgi:hypothetical protein
MSLRTVLPLVAMLGLLAACPATAQVDSAPMPRAKPRVMVCAESFFQVEVPSGIHGSCDSTPGGPVVIHFRPVPMPRAIVEVIGTVEFGYPDFGGCGSCAPVTMFRPAPIVRSAQPTSITAIEPTFSWNYSSSLPPPMPRAIVEVIGEENPDYYRPRLPFTFEEERSPVIPAYPVRIIRARQSTRHHPAAGVEVPGGWWLNEDRVPQPKCSASTGGSPQVVDEPPVSNNWWEPCDRGTGISIRDVAPMLKPAPPGSGQLSGTWFRDLDAVVISATFAGDELKLCMTQNGEGVIAHMTLTAHYAITKEGIVHGVITGADVVVKSTSAEGSARATTAMTEGIAEMQKLVDCPFSFRVKSTSIGVMVSNLRVPVDGMNSKEMAILCGMFRHAVDGKVPTARGVLRTHTPLAPCNGFDCPGPAPVPVNVGPPPCRPPMPPPTPVVPAGYAVPSTPAPVIPMMVPPTLPGETSSEVTNPRLAEVLGTKEAMEGGMTLPSGRYLDHYPQYFPPDPQHPLPRELAGQEDPVGATELAAQRAGIPIKPLTTPGVAGGLLVVTPSPTYSPPRPTHIPPGDFGMMSEVFGQMLGAKSQPWAASATVPPPVVPTAPVPPMAIPTPPRSESPR